MDFLRTPEDRFAALHGYPFEPHYVFLGDLRMHYVDKGSPEGSPVLLLHGEPSWSYLYRKMIPVIVAARHRVIAPDLFGFGKSDKPKQVDDYTYQFHVDSIIHLITSLDLHDITLVCQDWGGLIGLRVAAEHADRFARIVASNTFLPTGDHAPSEAFFKWRAFSQSVPEFPVGNIVNGGCVETLSADTIKAYDAPYPDETYKAGARAFPMLVPVTPDDPASAANRRAWEVLRAWEKPFLTAFSDSDPITAGADRLFHKLIPGAKGQPHTTIVNAGHFVQEDKGEEFAQVIVDFMGSAV